MKTVIPISKSERSLSEIKRWVREDTADALAIVVLVKKPDDSIDVNWSRQSIGDLSYAGRRLEQEIRWIMDGITESEAVK